MIITVKDLKEILKNIDNNIEVWVSTEEDLSFPSEKASLKSVINELGNKENIFVIER